MKKISFSVAALFLAGISSAWSIPPFEYVVAVRSAEGKVRAGAKAEFVIDLVDAPSQGDVIYSETHSSVTGNDGVTALMIGEGNTSVGNFDAIDWNKPMYLSVKVAVDNDNSMRSLGTMELLSVPNALRAKTATTLRTTDSTGKTYELRVADNGELSWTSIGGAAAYDQSKVPEKLYFIGTALNWNVAEAVEFTKVSPTLFTIDRHLTPDEIFKFTQSQYWGELDWSAQSCKIGIPNKMQETGNTPKFYGDEGDYTLTVDFYNYTLTITPK